MSSTFSSRSATSALSWLWTRNHFRNCASHLHLTTFLCVFCLASGKQWTANRPTRLSYSPTICSTIRQQGRSKGTSLSTSHQTKRKGAANGCPFPLFFLFFPWIIFIWIRWIPNAKCWSFFTYFFSNRFTKWSVGLLMYKIPLAFLLGSYHKSTLRLLRINEYSPKMLPLLACHIPTIPKKTRSYLGRVQNGIRYYPQCALHIVPIHFLVNTSTSPLQGFRGFLVKHKRLLWQDRVIIYV